MSLINEKFCAYADVYEKTTNSTEPIHGISKKRFMKLVYPPLEDNALATACFNFFDNDKDGVIGLLDYVEADNIINRHSGLEKFRSMFLKFFLLLVLY